MKGDKAYFRQRATAERAAALEAEHPKARDAHLQLAARYDDLANGIEGRERYLGLDENETQQSA